MQYCPPLSTIFMKVSSKVMCFSFEVGPPHTSENVKAHFEDQLDIYNIQCFMVVTDNAGNMKHAFELMTAEAENSSASKICDK